MSGLITIENIRINWIKQYKASYLVWAAREDVERGREDVSETPINEG